MGEDKINVFEIMRLICETNEIAWNVNVYIYIMFIFIFVCLYLFTCLFLLRSIFVSCVILFVLFKCYICHKLNDALEWWIFIIFKSMIKVDESFKDIFIKFRSYMTL